MNPRPFAAGLLSLTLTACAVGPDYKTPETPLAPFQAGASVSARADRPAAAPLDRWWTGFNDPILDKLIDRALEQNLDIAAAYARVRQARAGLEGAAAQLLPAAAIDGQDARQRQSLNSPTGAIAKNFPGYERYQSDYTLGAAASWEIDLAGGLRRGAEAAGAEVQAAEAAGVATRISIAAEVADAYFRLRGDQARLAVTQEQVATDQHLLELVKMRFSHELASDREVAQAEALLAQARSTLQPLEIDRAAQSHRLAILIGLQPGTLDPEIETAGDLPEVPAVPGDSSAGDLLRRRPDLIAAERSLAASNARIGVALSDYYPKLSLSGLLGLESISANQLFKQASFQPQAAAGLRWRLFDFGRVDAEVEQAKGAEAEALAKYRLSVLRAAGEVEDAFTTLVQTEARGQELAREVVALKRARNASQTAYERGVIPLTDVLDADRQLLTAQDALTLSRADAARAAVGSYRALGGGWTV
ncbi:MAG TPA: efflux transporter outer membrane subunit [Magnetospirillaceae bacterium]|nr:efflux transporter outer membrane subunit [Magnetospirillaceae bacterium]